MKLLNLNINGVKAFYNRNVLDELITKYTPDVFTMQEVKASQYDTHYWLSDYKDSHYVFTNQSVGKKGYSGVSMMINKDYLKGKTYSIEYPTINTEDEDLLYYGTGRVITLYINNLIISTVYTLNSGSEKYELREDFDKWYKSYIKSLDITKEIILCGDYNVCHTELDQWNWNNSYDSYPGLYEFEINNFSDLLSSTNLVDVWRYHNPSTKQYTWFDNRYPNNYPNKGWRLDYILTNNPDNCKVMICKDKVSDHYPLYLEYTKRS